jgi:hypothetical protein
MDPWCDLLDLARSQRGLIAVRQAVGLGVASSTFHARVRRERWPRLAPGTYALPGVEVVAEHRARAAALALGPQASITGRSALCLHGLLDRWPVAQHLVVPHAVRAPRWPGARVRRSVSLRPGDAVERSGVHVAVVQRALLDAAACEAGRPLEALLLDARQRGADLGAVRERAAAATPRTAGRRQLLAALDVVEGSGADSELVRLVEERLRADRLPFDVPPRTVEVPGRRLHPDVTLTGLPVGIECDGHGKYDARRGLDLDQRKHNAYRLVGWWILRIGWRRVHHDWAGFRTELLQAIALARGELV